MNPLSVIAKHAEPCSEAYRVLVIHSILVTRKALALARAYVSRSPEATLDLSFLEEIGMLHDIGIVRVRAPEIGCHGEAPYLAHGVLGREMLEAEGLPRHALACERHTGAGITREEVAAQDLPLPRDRDYLPITLEEKLLCVADKFYGKKPGSLWDEKTLRDIDRQMEKHGESVSQRWKRLWSELGAR